MQTIQAPTALEKLRIKEIDPKTRYEIVRLSSVPCQIYIGTKLIGAGKNWDEAIKVAKED